MTISGQLIFFKYFYTVKVFLRLIIVAIKIQWSKFIKLNKNVFNKFGLTKPDSGTRERTMLRRHLQRWVKFGIKLTIVWDISFLSNNFHVLRTSRKNKLKMKVLYKIWRDNYYWNLRPLKSNKAIKNTITIAKKITLMSHNMAQYQAS